jgi:hypothetical protein
MFDMMIDMLNRCEIDVLKNFLKYYGDVVKERKGNLTIKVIDLKGRGQ